MSDIQDYEAGRISQRSSAIKPLFIAFLVIYFFYLVLSRAPASIAAWAAHEAVPNLWLTNEQGTLWKGFARNAQIDLGNESLSLGRVDWSFNPWSLLVLRPCIQIVTDGAGQSISGNFCQSPFGGTSIENANFDAPVSMLSALFPEGTQAAGNVSVQVIDAQVNIKGKAVTKLDARFSWQSAAVDPGQTWISLGAFGGTASADGQGGVAAKLVDIEGPMGLDLTLGWAPSSNDFSIKGTVSPRQGTSDMILQALQAFGEERDGGTYFVSFP